MKKTIFVKTTFDGIHKWKNAPSVAWHLRYPHRHRFYVELEVEVKTNDREIEFYFLKDWLDKVLKGMFKDRSCEQMCEYILDKVRQRFGGEMYVKVEVSEDNQNGARLYYDGKRRS